MGHIPTQHSVWHPDIYYNDRLGKLDLSKEDVFRRDKFVFDTLTAADIPWVMTLGGGYSKESYLLVSQSVQYILNTWYKNS